MSNLKIRIGFPPVPILGDISRQPIMALRTLWWYLTNLRDKWLDTDIPLPLPDGPIAGANATYLTATDEHTALPNSRHLIAGTNITFDDSVDNERTVSATTGVDTSDPIVGLAASAVIGFSVPAPVGTSDTFAVGESAAYRIPDGGYPPDTEGEDRTTLTAPNGAITVLGTITVNVPDDHHVFIQASTVSETTGGLCRQRFYISKGDETGDKIGYQALNQPDNGTNTPVAITAVDTDPSPSQQYTFYIDVLVDMTPYDAILDFPIFCAICFLPSGGIGESVAHSPVVSP